MTFLNWLFESWHFAGFVVLVWVCTDAVVAIVKDARGSRSKGGA